MKKKFLLLTLLITTAAFSASKAADQDNPEKKESETKQTELTSFGSQICDATLKGLKETLKILNLEFGIRLQMDDKQLKESGLTIEEAIKQNEAMINTLADDNNADETKPDSCNVTNVADTTCDEIYKKVASEGAFGVKIDPNKATQAGKAMNIDNCGLVSIVAGVNDTKQPVDFAVAKTNERWSIIVGFATPPAQNDDKQDGGQKPAADTPPSSEPK